MVYISSFLALICEVSWSPNAMSPQAHIKAQILCIWISVEKHKFFSRVDVPWGHQKNPPLALKNHDIFLFRKTSAVQKTNPGWGFNGVGVEKMGQDVISFDLRN